MAARRPAVVLSMPMFDGDAFLGEVEVFPASLGGNHPFPSSEIRISRHSPPSDRCAPLAVLQAIEPKSMRCKLRAKPLLPESPLHLLHSACLKESMTAVVEAGEEELHLVAMQSRVECVPCFWCWSARSGLYAACLGMLNERCLAIVFDLDETLVVSYTRKLFDDRIDQLRHWISCEDDAGKLAIMFAEFEQVWKDRDLLEEFAKMDSITVNGRTLRSHNEAVLLPTPGGQQLVVRPVIRLPQRNAVLTRINPKSPDSSVLVNIRPGWDDLKRYLTANGRKRFKVYVCTMAGRDYALEIWRLLDPEANLISSEELSERLVCVKPNSEIKKSLQRVFQESACHPNMAMVIDDRPGVWHFRDQHRVHPVPAYNPYHTGEKEVNALPVLRIVRNVACHARGGFFREFDGNLLREVHGLMYENELLDLPYTPDVGDYVPKVFSCYIDVGPVQDNNFAPNIDPSPIPGVMIGAEVEGSLEGQILSSNEENGIGMEETRQGAHNLMLLKKLANLQKGTMTEASSSGKSSTFDHRIFAPTNPIEDKSDAPSGVQECPDLGCDDNTSLMSDAM